MSEVYIKNGKPYWLTDNNEEILLTVEMLKTLTEEIVKSLGKQQPKKPTGYNSIPHYRCPTCKKAVSVFCDSAKNPYCHWCGQALDWSEEYE